MEKRYWFYNEEDAPKNFFESVILLIGHLFGGTIMFAVVLVFGWGASWLVHFLNGIHPFPIKMLEAISDVELWYLYFDLFLFGSVLFAGAFRFIKNLARG